MPEHKCRRPGCAETFTNQFDYDIHLLGHDLLPWEAIDNYPRAPSQR